MSWAPALGAGRHLERSGRRHVGGGRGRHRRVDGAARGRVRTGIGRTLDVVLVLAVVAAVLVAYGLVDNRWYRVVSIAGGSMAPAIAAGDAIVILRPPEKVEPGMIVTMEVDGQVVTHRVVDVTTDGSFRTAGDANDAIDDWGDNQVRVVGRHLLTLPGTGRLLVTISGVRSSNTWLTDRLTLPTGASGAP
jgi:signal peptidase I